jgi:hypothetical protein
MDLDYNTRLAAIQRNEKLAQIMQQQAFQPVDIQSYQGIQAPISPLSGLAKVLQAYMGAKGTGEEERIKLNQEAKAEAQQMLSSLNPTASPGRAAVIGMPEVQARPATSFTPMGSDFEDNPNLQVAPSGNVETPAVAYQPAVAPQAAIPPTSGMPLDPEQKRQRLVQMMMSQNPYIAPVAKLEYEQLGKQDSGPLAEYKLYAQQAREAGQTPLSIDAYKTRQILAGRAVSNNVVNMPAGAPIPVMRNGKLVYVQMGKDGQYVEVQGIAPPPTQTSLEQELRAAGITPDMPEFKEKMMALIDRRVAPPAANVVMTDAGPVVANPNASATPLTLNGVPIGKTPKPVPENVLKAMLTNSTSERQVDTALQLLGGKTVDGLQGDSGAIGPIQGRIPDTVLQKTNPNGVVTRAAIADIGSMIIHDRSGAAVTIAEMPRLIPFIPQITDTPEAAKAKLTRMKAELTNIGNEFRAVHESAGYTMPTGLQPNAKVANPKPTPTQADINYAKNNPSARQKFRDQFGVEP